MLGSLLYSLVRVLLDLFATSRGNHAKLQAEVFGLRRSFGASIGDRDAAT